MSTPLRSREYSRLKSSAAVIWGLFVFLQFAPAVSAQIAPDPMSMDIYCDDVKLGTLSIKTYTTTKFTDKDDNKLVGAGLVAEFVREDPNCIYNFQWIQSIYAGKGTIGQNDGSALPYLDPYKRDDNLPWYWTTPENNTQGVGANGNNGPGTRFADFPSQLETNAGNFIKFETAFVCVDGLNISYLKGFTWGYQVNADMTSSLFPFLWLNDPTANLTGPTTAWDGTMNNKGGGAPVGYKFSDECVCECTPVPEPSTWFAGGAAVVFVLFHSLRRRKIDVERRAA